LVSYSNKHEYIETSLHQISIELREMESNFFDIRIRQEINVSPMKYYIQAWLKQALLKIIEEDQLGTVETNQPTITKDYIKYITSIK